MKVQLHGGNTSTENSKNEIGNSKKQYNLERSIQLSTDKKEEINWDEIQTEVEEIYTVMPTITLDLYQTTVNKEDILNFNSFLDDLATSTRDKKEDVTLDKICDMYSNVSKFADNISQDEVYKVTLKAKENVLRAYSKVNREKWEEVQNNIQRSLEIFSVLLTNNSEKQVNINKVYVILNELKNASNKKEKEIFYIKYKNLLEEINSL